MRWEDTFDFGKMGDAMSDLAGYFFLADVVDGSYKTYLATKEVIAHFNRTMVKEEARARVSFLAALTRAGKTFSDAVTFLKTIAKTSALTGLNMRPWKLAGNCSCAIYLMHSLYKGEESTPCATDERTPLDGATVIYLFQKDQKTHLDNLDKMLALSIVCISIFGSVCAFSGVSIPTSIAVCSRNVSFALSVGSAVCSVGSYFYGKQIENFEDQKSPNVSISGG